MTTGTEKRTNTSSPGGSLIAEGIEMTMFRFDFQDLIEFVGIH